MNSWGSYNPAIASDFVRQWECRAFKAYECSAGIRTIGYGHTRGVSEGDTISASEPGQYSTVPVQLLKEDLTAVAEVLSPFGNVLITRGQDIEIALFCTMLEFFR